MYAGREREKVEKYWGPVWREPIRVQVSSRYAIAQSLVTNGGKPGNEARSFPNFGRPLGSAAAEVARSVGSLDALDAVRFPQQLASVMPERAAYLLSGSFVQYLIDRKGGLARFRTL